MRKEHSMKRHHIIPLALLMVTFASIRGTRAPAQIMTRQLVCPGPIPAGWVKVDASTSPSDCNGNAWVIEPYTNKSVGSAMIVCADQPTPPGWQTLGVATSTGQCVGDNFAVGNIKSIQRNG
jgi:hypothetical protein